MAITFSGRKLWRIPQRGMIKGVCAGLACYLNVPVKLVRLIVVLSLIFGLFFFTIAAYIILTFALDPMPDDVSEDAPSTPNLLDDVTLELAQSERRLRAMERYVTSDAFTLRSRFRQL
ncbi:MULTISPECIES: envelope stress response membrane protein PspC [Tenebrionibacter/Tenebrionicola group]|jgi:phage shock protein C|uniref:Envelope stress response membrane protein PspC n=2 Tax=Tenebrionibacter/Tenebrionicola group TaxID=2969848 RepID=A0A8K0XXY8_9ENTR|nr:MULTISPECIES: envelope stress response membrane protein PspC [Tenebrionibacter/Tenebrionicola group]MBK4715862.1 envelope stress response membrane protein PspC [Tenebrionibacter intestinalis]MBV4411411.1 envelope stress response membrane protein PspC [Tenebrionicola larvae]MBV5096582.1 envelope stress response membrane protein PspC [Tenebrionicola larvae]